jgi:transposase InsO family protein
VTAVDHCDGCCVGHHVVKIGSRFAALESIAMGLKRYLGSIGADAGRVLALRMEHGTEYACDHFLNQIRFWGITPSFAFVAEPQSNGVAERFNRTLKEQAIYGRIFRNLEAVREAIDAFLKGYNAHWRLEKLGLKPPLQARQAALRQKAA